MADITKEIVLAALAADETLQYVSLSNSVNQGKILNTGQQRKYDAYKKKIDDYIAGRREPLDDPDAIEVGIPQKLRVKRRYTLSPEALAQRKVAGNSPAKAEGMKGNRNGWKHGKYAGNFINKLKPCKSTCPQYPCSLVSEGEIEPGDDCLDKVEVIQFFRAVHDAVKDKKYDDFNELASLQIGNTFKIIDMLIEDIMRDGSVVKREKRSALGDIIVEYVTHPSLLALPKLIADLGLNPAEFLITPRSIAKDSSERETAKTLAEMMSKAGRSIGKPAPKPEDY